MISCHFFCFLPRAMRHVPCTMRHAPRATHHALRLRRTTRPGAVVVGWDYGTYRTHGTYDYGTRGQGDCFVGDNGTMGQHHRATHHAPRTTHHAPRTTRHAPRTTHHAPRTTHCASGAPLFRLLAMQFGVKAWFLQEFAMAAVFFDQAVFKNHDFMAAHGH